MALGGPSLLLPAMALVLVLLASGSWAATVMQERQELLEGQTLSVRCDYSPQRGPYVSKTWCRQTSPGRCTRLVTTSQPRTAVEESPHRIWDDPEAGFFTVTMTGLREEHSEVYVCGSFDSSVNMVTVLRNISLVVSPALSTSPVWTTTWLPMRTDTNFFVSTSDLITPPEGTSDPSINGSEHRKSCALFSFDPASPGFLLSVQCGLLMAKGLVLSVACVLLGCRRRRGHKDTAGTEMMELSDDASPTQALDSLGAFKRIPEYRRSNLYSSPCPAAGATPNH